MKLRWFSPLLVALAATGASCSDPAGALPQGAIYIVVNRASSGTCSASGQPYALPSGTEAVQAIRSNGGESKDGEIFRAVDGDGGVDVSCTVEAGDQITLAGSIRKAQSVSFSVHGTFSPTAGGTVTISEFDNLRVSQLKGECTIDPQYVAAGAIWANFDCPEFREGTEQCQANGVFVFENCDK